MKPPKTYPVRNAYETKAMINVKIRKSTKGRGREALRAIKAVLDDSCKEAKEKGHTEREK